MLNAWTDRAFLEAGEGRSAYAQLVRTLGRQHHGAWLEEPTPLAELFAALAAWQVLTVVRRGPGGCEAINDHVTRRLRGRLDERWAGRWFAGAPVLITANDHRRGLYNGDVAVVLRDAAGDELAVYPVAGGFDLLPLDALPPHEAAFALTVHKAQGSEYGRVMLVMPDDTAHPLLTRQVLYTGLTRARRQVVVVGSAPAMRAAVGRGIERDSGLSIWDGR